MKKTINKNTLKGIDLLIIDIDDCFIYHRTVAAANWIFLDTVSGLFSTKTKKQFLTTKEAFLKAIRTMIKGVTGFRPDKMLFARLLRLSYAGLVLYCMNTAREAVNSLGGRMSNRRIIERWAEAVKKIGITEKDYTMDKELLKQNMNQGVCLLYKGIKEINPGMHVAAISQHFSIKGKEDPMARILGTDSMNSNMFYTDSRGKITGYMIRVGDGRDKKAIADRLIKEMKPEKVGVIIGDYEDLGLLRLRKLKAVIYMPKIEKFIDKSRYEIAMEAGS